MKIFGLIKATKVKNLKYIVEEIKNIDTDIQDIFLEAVSTKEESIYKLELLSKKLELLGLKKDSLENAHKEFGEKACQLRSLRTIVGTITIVIAAILLFAFNMNVIYGIIYGLYLYSMFYTGNILREFNDTKEEVAEIFRLRSNTMVSCNNIINKKLDVKREAIKKVNVEKEDSIELMANKIISEFLENSSLLYISSEVSKYAIKMLQHELKNDSDNLMFLLNEAKKRVDSEKKYIDIARIRTKNEEAN